jgi:hypothetical protein
LYGVFTKSLQLIKGMIIKLLLSLLNLLLLNSIQSGTTPKYIEATLNHVVKKQRNTERVLTGTHAMVKNPFNNDGQARLLLDSSVLASWLY